jgi:hypothetical protein
MRATEFGRRERAEYVKVTDLKTGFSKKTGLPKAVARVYSKRGGYSSPHRYTASVDCVSVKSHVKVSCSCPDFMYRFEVVLNNKGAADIKYSNGEQPQDPGRPGCCKHLVMTFKELLNQGVLDGNLLFLELKK